MGDFFYLPFPRLRPYLLIMFDTITAEISTAADKLTHLRRFL
jgi:hypothetical protein